MRLTPDAATTPVRPAPTGPLSEDAALDRVYVPRSLLDRHGVDTDDAREIVAHPGFAACCDALARQALDGFRRAEAELAAHDTRALKPARVMMWGYRRLLDRMLATGFAAPRIRARLTKGERIRMAVLALMPA